ncbi:MAG: hypothetical protein GNW80_17240, partial [Asgard group archaeon]|nr:hypothetical protein [Asgard group archaeon]
MTPEEEKLKVPTKLSQKYYREVFDPAELISIIGLSTFYKREFAFLLEDGNFIRNISFKTSDDLVKFLTKNPIRRSYVG